MSAGAVVDVIVDVIVVVDVIVNVGVIVIADADAIVAGSTSSSTWAST